MKIEKRWMNLTLGLIALTAGIAHVPGAFAGCADSYQRAIADSDSTFDDLGSLGGGVGAFWVTGEIFVWSSVIWGSVVTGAPITAFAIPVTTIEVHKHQNEAVLALLNDATQGDGVVLRAFRDRIAQDRSLPNLLITEVAAAVNAQDADNMYCKDKTLSPSEVQELIKQDVLYNRSHQ
jgi:hypothetical protein